MALLADSSAVLTSNVLSQHQTAITLLGTLFTASRLENIDWLDLACGKGQIISQLKENLPDTELRARIRYYAYDIENQHTRLTERLARELDFGGVEVKVGDMGDFTKIFPLGQKFDFISFTNTVHELPPNSLASLLVGLILRLSDNGVLYIYDMEHPPVPELGAVPWDGNDFKELIRCILENLGLSSMPLLVQRWQHSSCSSWSINLARSTIQLSDEAIVEQTEKACAASSEVIVKILEEKLRKSVESLEILTRYGSENEEENKNKNKLLYDFWSLKRSLSQTL